MDYNKVKTVKVLGVEMKYLTFGKGKENLVIISGLSLGDIFDSADEIIAAYSIFTEKYTVYLFERKTDIESGVKIEDLAEDIVSACAALKIEKADFLGVSQGGMITQVIAGKYPLLVSMAVFASSAVKLSKYSLSVLKSWIEKAESGKTRALTEDFFIKLYSEKVAEKYKDYIDEESKKISENDLLRFSRLAAACLSFDGERYIGKIKCPAFAIGGRDDAVLTAAATTDISNKLNCGVYIYEDFGHAVYDLAPDFKKRVLDFLNTKNA